MLLKRLSTHLINKSRIPLQTVQYKYFSTKPNPGKEYNAELILDCDNALGECPLWDDTKNLLCWIDCKKCEFWTFDPETNKSEVYDLPERPGNIYLVFNIPYN